jgi:hypothetical protein
LVGYVGGVKALNQLLGHARGAIDVAGDEGVRGWLAQQIQTTLQTKQLLAISHLKPEDEQHRAQLLRLLRQGQRSKGDAADGPARGIERGIMAMLTEIPWEIGPKTLPQPLQEWADKAVELRAEEEMLVAAGEKTPELDELMSLEIPLSRHMPPDNKSENNKGP